MRLWGLGCRIDYGEQVVEAVAPAGVVLLPGDIECRGDYPVRRAAQGEVVLAGVPDSWVGRIADNVERNVSTEPVLTQREVEVLEVAAEGLTARQISHRLGVRERTVTTHLGRIYRKLGTSGRVAALAAASEFGMLALARRQ